MIFGKYINKYYLKNAPILILGLAALILVDYFQLFIPELYRMGHQRHERRYCSGQRPGGGV